MRGKSIFKEEPLDTNFFRNFLKQQQLLRIVVIDFSISFIRLVETDFLPSENNNFLGQSYFAASRNHSWNQEKTVLKERTYSCYWTTDFLASAKPVFSTSFKFFNETLHFVQAENRFPPGGMKDSCQKHVYISQENKPKSGRYV